MDRVRGFLLKHRVNVVFRPIIRRRRSPSSLLRLEPSRGIRVKRAVSRVVKWSNRLRTKAKAILQSGRGLMRVGQEPVLGKPEPIPNGHVAVYVGQKGGGDFERIWVPVVYCSHPLFGDLLRVRKRIRVQSLGWDNHTLSDLGVRESPDPDPGGSVHSEIIDAVEENGSGIVIS